MRVKTEITSQNPTGSKIEQNEENQLEHRGGTRQELLLELGSGGDLGLGTTLLLHLLGVVLHGCLNGLREERFILLLQRDHGRHLHGELELDYSEM